MTHNVEPLRLPALIDCNTLAEMLGCDRSTVWRKAARGLIPRPIKVAGMTRWRLREIEDAIDAADQGEPEAA